MALTPKQATALISFIWVVIIGITFIAIFAGQDRPKDKTPTKETPVNPIPPLDEYVWKEDGAYSYTVLPEYTRRNDRSGYTAFVLNMTSQIWLTPELTDRSIWWHYMIITIPDEVVHNDVGVLYITGGDNTNAPPDPNSDLEARLVSNAAAATGMITATLRQNPNQPIRFPGDPRQKNRREDDIIAYTFRHFIEGHIDEPEWLLMLPMTKASVKALDTMQNFASSRLKRFYVAGASKRGWATWLTGAVDKRVVGITPMVLDMLDMLYFFKRMHRAFNGGYSWAMSPYWEENVTYYLDDPNNKILTDICDPLAYKDRLTMPKYVISAGADEFFMPDDTHIWWNQMKGVKYFRMHQNAEHTLAGSWRQLAQEVAAFILSIEENYRLPVISWQRLEGESEAYITLYTDVQPIAITAWSANTVLASRRDFRLVVGRTENTTDVVPQLIVYRNVGASQVERNIYRAAIKKPRAGWNCFFIEVKYQGPKETTLVFTSETHIVPDVYPIETCQGLGCVGRLV